MTTNLKALVGKLNDTTRGALEAAAGLCLARTHYDIEIEHYLLKLLEAGENDFLCILRAFAVDRVRLEAQLVASIDKLKVGNARTPAFSPSLVKMFSAAWTLGSMEYDAAQVRSGFTILVLAADEELRRLLVTASHEFGQIEPERLRKDFEEIVGASREEVGDLRASGPSLPVGTKTPHLDQYTVNLTENARLGKIDPVVGRDVEIRQLIDILCRRRQNNPILTGEAGVGKTAVVEGLAQRIVNEERCV